MRASTTIVLLFAAAVIQALPIPNNYGGYSGAPAPASPPPPGYDGFSFPPVNPYENGVPPPAGTEVPPPAESTEVPPPTESTEVPPPAGTEVPPPAESTEVPPPDESTEVPPPADTEVHPPAESTEVPPPAATEVPPPAESTEVPPPAESTEVPPPAGTEVPPPAESTEVPPPSATEVTPPVESEVPPPAGTEVPPPVESEVPSYDAEVPPTETEVPPATTEVLPTGTEVPPAATEVPPTVTEVPPAQTELPPTVHTTTPESASNYPQRLQRPVEIECRVSKTGFEPKEMSVKKGDTIKFKVSGGGKFGIRHGDDATACVPLQAGTATSGGDQTLSYTVPEDASNKIIFYNVEGNKCSKTDMSATLNVASNLVADSPSLASGPPTTGGTLIRAPVRMSNAISNLPTLAFVGALSFIASLVQI